MGVLPVVCPSAEGWTVFMAGIVAQSRTAVSEIAGGLPSPFVTAPPLVRHAGQKREARLRARGPGPPRLTLLRKQDVDARHKAGHDEKTIAPTAPARRRSSPLHFAIRRPRRRSRSAGLFPGRAAPDRAC